jgi:hypothetical protein
MVIVRGQLNLDIDMLELLRLLMENPIHAIFVQFRSSGRYRTHMNAFS